MTTLSTPRDFLRVHKRYRAASLSVFGMVMPIAVTYVLMAPRTYEASAQLLIEPEPPNVLAFDGVINDSTGRVDYYQTQSQLLRTRALARATIEGLDLWAHPDLAPIAGGWWWRLPPALWSALNREDKRPAPAADSAETPDQSRAVDGFLERLTVTPQRNSRLITISYSSGDPAVAARVANSLTSRHIDEHREFRRVASKEASEWLAIQLNVQRTRVADADAALQRYREQHGVPAVDEPHVLVQRIADLNQALTRAKTERFEKESLYRELVALGTRGTVEATLPVATSHVLQNLQLQLMTLRQQETTLAQQVGDRHPDLIAVRASIRERQAELEAEVARRVDGARADLVVAEAQEQKIADALAAQRRGALALGQSGIEYGVLQQEAAGARDIFAALLQRTKEADVVGRLTTTNMRVADEATAPIAPASPRTWLILVVALFAASTLALALPLVLNALDDKVREPEDLPALGLPFLGLTPSVDRRHLKQRALLLDERAPEAFAESLRHISASLLFSSRSAADRTVLFTSAGPGEGKSTAVANVAIALANRGSRVLLVDADIREPRQHELFGVPLTPGLTQALRNQADFLDVVRRTASPNLFVATAGRPAANPADLLGPERLGAALHNATAVFDWVLVDSPPAIAFADASLLAHAVSMVVLVVAAKRTSQDAVRTALACLDPAPRQVAGAVLSNVDVRHDNSPYTEAARRTYRHVS